MTAPKTSPSTSLPDKHAGSPEDTPEGTPEEIQDISADAPEDAAITDTSDTTSDTEANASSVAGEEGTETDVETPIDTPEASQPDDADATFESARPPVSEDAAQGVSDVETASEPDPAGGTITTDAAADAAKVVQVQPGQRRGPGLKAVGRPGLKTGLKGPGSGRPGIKTTGPAGTGLRKQPSLTAPDRDATPPKAADSRPSPTETGRANGASGRPAAKGARATPASEKPARDRSPEDVQERANRRAAALARQAAEAEQASQNELDEVDPATLPVPKPKGKPPVKNARQKKEEKKTVVVQPPAQPARVKSRHWVTFFSFLLMVALPLAVAAWYLWHRAADQYASYVGFSVRTEEVGSSIEILGIATDVSGSSTSDTDILYEFLQGQELVGAIDADLDLRAIWAKANPDVDPIFAYHPPGTIEDLTSYWGRMVKIYYDPGTGLIDLRVLAFDPQDATAIATQIRDRSSAMINKLSAVAREDAIKYARDELSQAEDRLREARVEIQSFRNRTQLVDPTMQTQTQSGLIGALEGELANAQIELRLLQETARETDPRIRQTELKIEVIKQQIADERSELGLEGVDDNISVADLVGEYEILVVDLEFAQEAYTTALATFVSAQNEARRQTRYLAPHVNPTKAEKSQYPDRIQIMLLATLLLTLIWSVVTLTGYALRDRR